MCNAGRVAIGCNLAAGTTYRSHVTAVAIGFHLPNFRRWLSKAEVTQMVRDNLSDKLVTIFERHFYPGACSRWRMGPDVGFCVSQVPS